jgi:phosphoglycerate dehydrogenase-like enzyme
MSDYASPCLLLSDHFATRYAAELTQSTPHATVTRHYLDGSWDAGAEQATVVYMSSDMWFNTSGRDMLRRLPELPDLAWAHTSSAGVDNPSFGKLLARGVRLTNAAGVNGGVIAQHVLALMLSHARKLDLYSRFQSWRIYNRLQCGELYGGTVLVVGLGGIGKEVARLCAAFNMHVIGVRQRQDPVAHVDRLVTPDAFAAVLPEADFVVLACPLTDATRGLINAEALARMRPSSYVVNVARGPVVDAGALAAALHERRIAGAALDVFDREPLPPDSPLWSAPNLTITPHTAGSSPLNPERNARFFLANLARYVRGEPLENLVTSVE